VRRENRRWGGAVGEEGEQQLRRKSRGVSRYREKSRIRCILYWQLQDSASEM
jgi:hypothetical protein